MSCPNSDPNFNKILAKFNSDNPEKRKFIFYTGKFKMLKKVFFQLNCC